MDSQNIKRIKLTKRREGYHSFFKTRCKSLMILNQKPLEKIAVAAPETMDFLAMQKAKVRRSMNMPF